MFSSCSMDELENFKHDMEEACKQVFFAVLNLKML